jgi:hypothetical protein
VFGTLLVTSESRAPESALVGVEDVRQPSEWPDGASRAIPRTPRHNGHSTAWSEAIAGASALGYPFPVNEKPPADPAAHAEDFAYRYAEDLDIVAGQAMMDLRLANHQMGARDACRGSEHHSFFPGDREGGTVSPGGQVTVDSGLMNPDLLTNYDEETQRLWRRTRIGDRAQAIIAHELAEHEHGDHELALIAAPDTTLPISQAAREFLRQMERGWNRR